MVDKIIWFFGSLPNLVSNTYRDVSKNKKPQCTSFWKIEFPYCARADTVCATLLNGCIEIAQ